MLFFFFFASTFDLNSSLIHFAILLNLVIFVSHQILILISNCLKYFFFCISSLWVYDALYDIPNKVVGAVAQSVDRATTDEEVVGSISAVAASSLLVGSVSV